MSKKLIGHDVGSYTFDASAKTITFSGLPTITLDQILLITNVTDNIIIYNFSNPLLGGTLVGSVLTLDYDVTLQSDTDILQIYIDLPIDGVTLLSITITGVGASSAIDTTGFHSLTIQFTGNWNGGNLIEGSNDGSTGWSELIVTSLDEFLPQDIININGIYVLKTTTKYIRVNTNQFINGSCIISIVGRDSFGINMADRLAFTLDQNSGINQSVVIQNLNKDLQNSLILSDARPITFTGGVNSIFYIDTTGYQSLDITTDTTCAGALTASNDGVRWGTAIIASSLTAVSIPVSSLAAASHYAIPCIARYLKITLTAAGQAIGYLRNSPCPILGTTTQSNSIDRVAQTATVSTGVAGSLAIGGPTALAATVVANPVTIGGVDTTTSTIGVSTPKVRNLLMDIAGRASVGLFATDGNGIVRNIGALPPGFSLDTFSALAVKNIDNSDGQSIADLLSEILLELRINNQYVFELPRALQQSATTTLSAIDEPNTYRAEPTIFKL